MEGRAIARPDQNWVTNPAVPGFGLQWRAGRLPGRTRHDTPAGVVMVASMEGRAIARPDLIPAVRTMAENWQLQWRAGRLPGRTRTGSRTRPFPDSGFNGGPGDCPAGRQDRPRPWPYHDSASMEGRAIARPDTPRHPSRRVVMVASMEGRAIARPDTLTAPTGKATNSGFVNGGPGDCPAGPRIRRCHPACAAQLLQWRAGRLPGRTCRWRPTAPI